MSINQDHVLKAGQVFCFQNYTDELSLLVVHHDSDDKYYRTTGLTPDRANFTLERPVRQNDEWFRREMTYVGDFHDLYQRTFKDDQ